MNKLTEHFSVEEMLRSSFANKKGISNAPDTFNYYKVLFNLGRLCSIILEQVRLILRKPVIINSGYRNFEVNKAVGGVSNSRHLTGCAADFSIKGLTKAEVENLKAWARMNTDVIEFIVHDSYIHIAIAELNL